MGLETKCKAVGGDNVPVLQRTRTQQSNRKNKLGRVAQLFAFSAWSNQVYFIVYTELFFIATEAFFF